MFVTQRRFQIIFLSISNDSIYLETPLRYLHCVMNKRVGLMAKKKKFPLQGQIGTYRYQSQHATCTIGSHCFVPNLGPIALYLT